jgi:hypothetical protein
MSAERRDPAICNVSNIGEGKDEMIKASIGLQDPEAETIRQGEG